MMKQLESTIPLPEAVVLLGNGINRMASGPSWEDVLDGLLTVLPEAAPKLTLDRDKPFPWLYEEIFLNCARCGQRSESLLLEAVAGRTDRLLAGPLHTRVASLNVSHLLTTNYDAVTVESFLGVRELRNAAEVQESRYSLFRRVSNGRTVWQIHGSQAQPSSIMLGYEHYSGYLEQMRRYVTRSVEYTQGRLDGLTSRRVHGRVTAITSWVDFFFLANVGILGFSLDFVEMHLWWLLTYRARLRAENRSACFNRIAYFSAPENLEAPARRDARRRKLDMLRAADVEVFEVPSDSWPNYYDECLAQLSGWIAQG